MKNIIFLLLCVASFASCKAQFLTSLNPPSSSTPNLYFSDMDQDMNKFVGTWEYTNGSTTFILTLQKKLMVPFDNQFEDLLVGEYSYSVGGNTIVNTLPLLDNLSIVGREHNVAGREIYPNNLFVKCNDCGPNERRFTLSFIDPERTYLLSRLTIRYLIGSNPEKIKAVISDKHMVLLPSANSPTEPRVPYGEYIMTKQ